MQPGRQGHCPEKQAKDRKALKWSLGIELKCPNAGDTVLQRSGGPWDGPWQLFPAWNQVQFSLAREAWAAE